MSSPSSLWQRGKVWWLSVATGVALGGVFRLSISAPKWMPASPIFSGFTEGSALVMTISFLAIVPFAIGYTSVRRYLMSIPREQIRWPAWFFLPLIAVLLELIGFVLIGWEGTICVLMAAPILIIFALLGGVAARLVWHNLQKRSPGSLSAIAIPLVLIAFESYIPAPYKIRTVNTDIIIHAPASTVWSNIESVRAIAPAELPGSWVGSIGFPRPIAATLSHEGTGGVRQASFTGGLLFTERVNRWEPEKDLRFSIHANTNAIPPSTLDEHVTIGGAYFDVLDGEYRLEPRPDGILLHLSSHERLSTHFNPYAEQWTDAVMRSIQSEILTVIKSRCESEVAHLARNP